MLRLWLEVRYIKGPDTADDPDGRADPGPGAFAETDRAKETGNSPRGNRDARGSRLRIDARSWPPVGPNLFPPERDEDSRGPRGLDVWSWSGGRQEADAPRIVLDRQEARLEIHMPLLGGVPVFYQQLPDGLRVSNDLRLFARPELRIDPRGLYSLLQFGALLPPWSLFSGVDRVPQGTRTIFDLESGRMDRTPIDFFPPPGDVGDSSASDPASRRLTHQPLSDGVLGDALDAVLRRASPDGRPALLFSGGVDSGLLAARAAALGWGETLLLNYSRGKDDPESALAEAMARHLGLEFVRIEDAGSSWDEMLARVPALFPFPFGDFSAPTNFQIVEAFLAAHSDRTVVLDGAGADGGFGSYPKLARWSSLYRLPVLLRRTLSGVYRVSGRWRSDDKTAQRLAWARISTQMAERLAAVVAENALSGIAYSCGADSSAAVHGALLGVPAPPFAATDAPGRLLDLLVPVAEMMAQKTPPLLLGEAAEPVFPFLEPGIVRLGFGGAERLGAAGGAEVPGSKAALKRLLALHVPAEMVYRPKSGPEPPISSQLARASTREAFEEIVLSSRNPLAPWIDAKAVRALLHEQGAGRRLPHFAHNFLWTLLITSLWLDGMEPRRFPGA